MKTLRGQGLTSFKKEEILPSESNYNISSSLNLPPADHNNPYNHVSQLLKIISLNLTLLHTHTHTDTHTHTHTHIPTSYVSLENTNTMRCGA